MVLQDFFSCIINDNGIPSTVLMSIYDTDELNGVEVKFSVNQRNDFDKFKNEAQEVLMYFPVKPSVKGSTYFTVKEQTYIDPYDTPVQKRDSRGRFLPKGV